ncbi:hypothetical protein INT47_004953 [Mucor saturninus]|uniref:PB1 domain-containing protein n=1 Tax=Mucor saturninus TaxID=64648 RepID=A0A8H7R4R0_9FUNG|nr:hypothetical protein INT47_004953 [Mucor saturninus]
MTDYANLRKIVTGDIIIKCRLGNDIRRIPINQVPNYDELCLMMYRVFKTEISKPENIVLKYMDNEGDMISLLDDIDISHAISISSLLKITVFDKAGTSQSSSSLQVSLIEIRDSLNELIQSSKEPEPSKVAEKSEESKITRRLTPSELAEFLNATEKNEEDKKSPMTEKSTPVISSSQVPYYPPPPTSQVQVQPAPQLQQQPSNIQYIQNQLPIGAPQQQQRPISLQQNPQSAPQPNTQSSSYLPQKQQYSVPNYPPAPPQSSNINYDPRLHHQQQEQPQHQQHQQQPQLQQTQPQFQQQQPQLQKQQQPARQGYFVPPPPTSMNPTPATPQLPPQPYRPSTRW